ncbi:MAG: ribonuclease HII [Raoultibacter sp.]
MNNPTTPTTVVDIKSRLQNADAAEFSVLERSLKADTRKGVRDAVEVARRRLQAELAESNRLASLYEYQEGLAGCRLVVGLDEVGRGPVAGPLTVGAVVLPPKPRLAGLNDSKQVAPQCREGLSARIKAVAIAWAIEHIEADEIDAAGMSASLRVAFSRAVRAIEAQGISPEVILLDGNPLHLDDREINVVKGDARCASIAAASLIAKVERDRIMCAYAESYPEYAFEKSKGYASAEHIEAIKKYGLTPLHRKSFCTAFTQESLF